jgi:hypothetical protein
MESVIFGLSHARTEGSSNADGAFYVAVLLSAPDHDVAHSIKPSMKVLQSTPLRVIRQGKRLLRRDSAETT